MKDNENHTLTFDEFDEMVNPRPEECDFDRIVESALSRRGFLGGVMAFGSLCSPWRQPDIRRSSIRPLRVRPDRHVHGR